MIRSQILDSILGFESLARESKIVRDDLLTLNSKVRGLLAEEQDSLSLLSESTNKFTFVETYANKRSGLFANVEFSFPNLGISDIDYNYLAGVRFQVGDLTIEALYDRKNILQDYLQAYEETKDLYYLLLIQNYLVNEKVLIYAEKFVNRIRGKLRFLKNRLTIFQKVKCLVLRKLIRFHLKRFNVGSDDDDSLLLSWVKRLKYLFSDLIQRFNYELFREGIYYREVEFCYQLKNK